MKKQSYLYFHAAPTTPGTGPPNVCLLYHVASSKRRQCKCTLQKEIVSGTSDGGIVLVYIANIDARQKRAIWHNDDNEYTQMTMSG